MRCTPRPLPDRTGSPEARFHPPPPPVPVSTSGAVRHRVFVVDDHPIMREVMTAFVRAQPGLDVVGEAASGQEALDALLAAPCDLALVDVQMPGMDGIELV